MEEHLKITKQTRQNFLNLVNSLPIELLNEVPAGFNNNIIWNFAHIIVTQQILCYQLSGHSPKIDYKLVTKYKKGTKPEGFVDASGLEEIKGILIDPLDEFLKDLNSGLFTNYNSYTTSYGIALTSIEDAVIFNNVHEGLHLGYAMALRRAVSK